MNTVKEQMLIIEKVLLLKSLAMFRETPEPILAELAPLMVAEELEEGTIIFEEGEIGDCMYIIMSGQVNIQKENTLLAVLQEKEILGELSLLDAETRSATAIAKTDCLLYKIGQEPFYELVEARPEVAIGCIKILCARLRMLNEKVYKMQSPA